MFLFNANTYRIQLINRTTLSTQSMPLTIAYSLTPSRSPTWCSDLFGIIYSWRIFNVLGTIAYLPVPAQWHPLLAGIFSFSGMFMSAFSSSLQATSRDESFDFQGSFAPPQPSFLWRGFKVVVGLITETPLSVLGFIIAGLVMTVLFPPVAAPCFALAAATFSSKFLWKILCITDLSLIHTIERKAVQFQEDHPFLQAIALASTVGLLIVSQLASILAAALLGVYNGIVAEANHRFVLAEKNRTLSGQEDSLIRDEILNC